MRERLVADRALDAAALRRALVEQADEWLAGLFAAAVAVPVADVARDVTGLALVAVGGYGRGELAPASDFDLVLLHDPGAVRVAGRSSSPDIRDVADHVWYPVWDAKIGLDHAVRTPAEVDAVVRADLRAQLGLLDLRLIAGDAALAGRTRGAVLDRWTSTAPERIGTLAAEARTRWRIAGEAAFLLEPDLKESRGGLRDIGLLRALALAQLVDLPAAIRADHATLLDIRTALQRATTHGDDVLRLQEQAAVAHDVGLPDADAVLRTVNEAARRVGQTLDLAIRRAVPRPRAATGGALGAGLRRLIGRGASGPDPTERVPLARDVVAQDGEVVLARDADPWADPGLVLRAARAAAEQELPLAPFTLDRLATEAGVLPSPWPAAALADFVRLLGTGHAAVPVLESLDAAGLLEPLLPEWADVRYLAQHNPVHRFTVDRHLLETAADAAALSRQVDRSDLLLIGALLHDIGKGHGGDHSVVGARIGRPMAERMGLPAADVEVVVDLIRHHLLLPDTATRRDLDDPVTIGLVAEAARDRTTLGLLHALSIADAEATGPAAWSPWKARLIDDLVRRASRMLQGAPLPPAAEMPERLVPLAERGGTALVMTGDPARDTAEIDVVAADRPGVLSLASGVLALHSLDVQAATIRTIGSTAVNTFHVTSRFGSVPDVTVMRGDLERALAGRLPLADRLSAKEQTYAASPVPSAKHLEPVISWLDDAASEGTVLEVRTDDAIGLLYRLTNSLETAGVDVRAARVSSLGRAVVDVFYLATPAGDPVPTDRRGEITAAVRTATAASV